MSLRIDYCNSSLLPKSITSLHHSKDNIREKGKSCWDSMSKCLSDLFRKWDACGGVWGSITTTLSQQNDEMAIYHSVNKQTSLLKELTCLRDKLELCVSECTFIMYRALICNQPITAHRPTASLINWDAEHKHVPSHVLSSLPVMPSGPVGHHLPRITHCGNHHHGNCCTCYGWSSRKPGWITAPLMHRLTHLFCAVFLRCENSRALIRESVGEKGRGS